MYSSMRPGLVYFNQLSSISSLSLCLIVVGIVILLAGVIIVSTKPPSAAEENAEVAEGSSLDRILSPVNDHILSPTSADPTESEALLANAGGIAGPHLPPPSFTLSMPPVSERQAGQGALSDSPPALGSPLGSPTSPERPRRSSSLSKPRSASSSHHHLVGLGLQPAFHYVEGSSDHPPPHSPSKTNPGSTRQRGLPNSPRTPSTVSSPTTGSARDRRRRSSAHLYSSILSRGLSIGLSPASPGFHIGPFSPADEEEEEAEARAEAEAERRRVLAGDLEGQGGRGARGRAKALAQRMDRRTLSEGFLDEMRGSDAPGAPDAMASGSALDVSSPEPPVEGHSAFPSTSNSSQQVQVQAQAPAPQAQAQTGDGRTLAPTGEPSAAPGSASTSAFRLFLPSVALDSTTLSERLSRLNPLGSSSSSSSSAAPAPAPAPGAGPASSVTGGSFVRGGGGRGAYWPSLTGGVREWWSQNVNGREGFREGERRRLLDG